MTAFASDFRPCLACQMPEFDHGDGSPTDHPYEPDLDWVPPMHEQAPVPSPERYTVSGKAVLCDGQEVYDTAEPEFAQALVEALNGAVRHDRESRARVTSKVRRDRLRQLEAIIDAPSTRTERLKMETPAHWAARAVMDVVDGWL